MTLRGLVFIALRFYAITFFMQVVPTLPLMISPALQGLEFQSTYHAGINPFPYTAYGGVVTPILYFIMSLLLWFASGRLALAVAREYNPEIRFDLTFEDALAFAFVLLGLYFTLNSIAGVIVRFTHLLMIPTGTTSSVNAADTYSRAKPDFLSPSISLIAGLASMLGSRVWARRLARRSTATTLPGQ